MHSRTTPHTSPVMGCLSCVFRRKIAAIYQEHTVLTWCTFRKHHGAGILGACDIVEGQPWAARTLSLNHVQLDISLGILPRFTNHHALDVHTSVTGDRQELALKRTHPRGYNKKQNIERQTVICPKLNFSCLKQINVWRSLQQTGFQKYGTNQSSVHVYEGKTVICPKQSKISLL